MAKTLYLLRRSVDTIDPSLFVPSESRGDIVLLEHGLASVLSHDEGEVLYLSDEPSRDRISYDDLIERLFQNDRTVVI